MVDLFCSLHCIDLILIYYTQAQPLIEALLELQKHKKKAQRETSLILPSQQLLETVSK